MGENKVLFKSVCSCLADGAVDVRGPPQGKQQQGSPRLIQFWTLSANTLIKR